MNAVQEIYSPKFLYICACSSSFQKNYFIYFYDTYMKKKKGFYTNLCRFEIFSMKIVYAMEPEL